MALERQREGAKGSGRLFSGSHRKRAADWFYVGKRRRDACSQIKTNCSASKKLEQAMRQIPAFQNMAKQIRMTITAEGLRIDLLETQRGLFFETGNPRPTEAGSELLKLLAARIIEAAE